MSLVTLLRFRFYVIVLLKLQTIFTLVLLNIFYHSYEFVYEHTFYPFLSVALSAGGRFFPIDFCFPVRPAYYLFTTIS